MKLKVSLLLGVFLALLGLSGWLITSDPQFALWARQPEVAIDQQHQALKKEIIHVLGTSDELATNGTQRTTQSGRESVVVSKIIDGDTIQLKDGRKVRYIGMDTPELHHPQKGKECFGAEAATENEKLVLNKTVQLEKDVNETDRYGRLLRYVWVDDILVNAKLVSGGYAFARSYPPDVTKQDELRAAEADARDRNQGLWAGCSIDSNRTQRVYN